MKILTDSVYINASPQRREAVLQLQNNLVKLTPVQDIRIRGNSKYLMLRRGKRLKDASNEYSKAHAGSQFALTPTDRRKMGYLLCMTEIFYQFTKALSKTKEVTIHNAFEVYNLMFDHLGRSIDRLKKRWVSWKREMLLAIQTGREKLKNYYSRTEELDGNLYAIGTILASQHKLKFLSGKVYGNDYTLRRIFKEAIKQFVTDYMKQSI
ncbi:uncharacterized protein N7483_002357 [Penicillium malachiteum]|uniref:uncharacterized protein n=1 Tax=Penicillium malachiteum TaxID=1324776 RepID=UPI002547E94D|nr:uncharacterized protein N7483_002357 [Penicillium malachiteum]KAJ5737232.1 hypothetical protein N7483_002357 [Penicillium malachiteum]